MSINKTELLCAKIQLDVKTLYDNKKLNLQQINRIAK